MGKKHRGVRRFLLIVVVICLLSSFSANYYLLTKQMTMENQIKSLSSSSGGRTSQPSSRTSSLPDQSSSNTYSQVGSSSGADSASGLGSDDNDLLLQQLAAAQTAEMTMTFKSGARLEEKCTYDIPVRKKYVFLTFDDGPSDYTPKLLKILKNNNVKATFFVEYNPVQDYYRQIVSGGHTLALHTYTHDYAKVYASETAFFSDLNRISDYVKGITGIDTKIIRLAGGSSNTVSRQYNKGVMTRITADLNDKGYTYFDWNAQCMDATSTSITPAQILSNVKSFTVINGTPKPFVILLMHNGKDEPTTPDAVQSVIDYYKSLNYTFAVITKDTPAIHQPVQN